MIRATAGEVGGAPVDHDVPTASDLADAEFESIVSHAADQFVEAHTDEQIEKSLAAKHSARLGAWLGRALFRDGFGEHMGACLVEATSHETASHMRREVRRVWEERKARDAWADGPEDFDRDSSGDVVDEVADTLPAPAVAHSCSDFSSNSEAA